MGPIRDTREGVDPAKDTHSNYDWRQRQRWRQPQWSQGDEWEMLTMAMVGGNGGGGGDLATAVIVGRRIGDAQQAALVVDL